MPEDTPDKCCVCNKDQQYHSNRLLVCGNCAVTVHEGCYGVQKSIGLANWFCRKCESQVRISKIRCDLCPIKEGAFKRSGGTRCGWAHILCAIYFPEAYFKDPETMDLIMLDNIPSDRYGRPCVFCERNQRTSQANHGACIQCSWTSCRTYFHVTCAHLAGLLSELPPSAIDSTESLAVVLAKVSNRNSDSVKLPVGNDGDRSSTCNSESPSEVASLHAFCSVRHKEKFAESVSQTSSVLANSPVNAKPLSPVTAVEVTTESSPSHQETFDPPFLCTSLIHSTPTTTTTATLGDTADSHTGNGGTAFASGVSSTADFEARSQSPMKNTSDPIDGHLKNRTTRKNPMPEDALNLSESTCPKRPKSEAPSQKDGEAIDETDLFRTSALSNGPSTLAPDSTDLAGPRLSPETKGVHSHPTGAMVTSADITAQVSPAIGPQNSVADTVSFATKPSRNRRGQRKSHHKPGPKSENASAPSVAGADSPNAQRNLPLTWPQRPVSIRGLGLPVKSTPDNKNSSSLLSDQPNSTDTSNSSRCSSSGAFIQSPLATMQDLLEWQWDQAGALLMQQVEGTDVVSLLDCLHQLKAENDSLEAKLVRLKTRQEHLRSVNARLAASLATMEAATVTMPSGEKLLARTTVQPAKSTAHDEASLQTQSAGGAQPSTHLNARSTTHAPRGSPDQIISGSPSLLPTVSPNLSPITVAGVCSSSTFPSPFPSPSFQSPYHPPQSLDASKLASWQTKSSSSVPSSSPTSNVSNHANTAGHPKQTRRTGPNSPSKRSQKQWLTLSCSNEIPLRPSSTTDAVASSLQTTANSTSLVELSARLSSAIAARQVNSLQPGSDMQSKGNCHSRRIPEYVPIAKNVTAYPASVNRIPTTSSNKSRSPHTEPIPNSGLLTHYSAVSNNPPPAAAHPLAETDHHSVDRQLRLQGGIATTIITTIQQSGLSTTSSYLSSAGSSVPPPILPATSILDTPTAQALLSASTLPDHPRS